MKLMENQLIELFNLHSPSREEEPVRDYLKPLLTNLMDEVVVDDFGNLLGVKTVGTGSGATILLSAHMDTVRNIRPDKRIVKNKGVYTAELLDGSGTTILGADDKAGIAVLLEVLRNIPKKFDGVIKVAFTVEEETGCNGSESMDVEWYKDADLAIVFDRRGSSDIVVGAMTAFCNNEVCLFMDHITLLTGLYYECTTGSFSDAVTFSSNGINTVNLSVGFYDEHTHYESLEYSVMEDTAILAKRILREVNKYYGSFGRNEDKNFYVKNFM